MSQFLFEPRKISAAMVLRAWALQARSFERCPAGRRPIPRSGREAWRIDSLEIGHIENLAELLDAALDCCGELRIAGLERSREDGTVGERYSVGVVAHIVEGGAAEPRLAAVHLLSPTS